MEHGQSKSSGQGQPRSQEGEVSSEQGQPVSTKPGSSQDHPRQGGIITLLSFNRSCSLLNLYIIRFLSNFAVLGINIVQSLTSLKVV